MRLVWVVIPLVLIGVIGISESFATQCTPGIIRMEDVNHSPIELVIGKDTLHISGTLVSLTERPQDVLLTFRSADAIGFHCGGSTFLFPNYINEGLHFEKISSTPENIILDSYERIPFEIELKPLKSGAYQVEPIAQTKYFINVGWKDRIFVAEMSPLKQVASQIVPENVTCNEGFELIFKSSDNSPVCVTSDTAAKLIIRGWIPAEKNIEPKSMPVPYVFPKYTDFVNSELSHYPKLNETATITISTINPYSFDLTLEDDQFLSIYISNDFEFVNVPEEKIHMKNGYAYSIHEPLLAKQNQTQSLSVEIKSLTDSKNGHIHASGVGGMSSFPLDEFKILSDIKSQDKPPAIEVTEEEFREIIEQRSKIQDELDQCRLILDDWGSPSINYEEHRKLVQNFHTCENTIRDSAISAGINLTDCYSSPSLKAKMQNQSQYQGSLTLEEALESMKMQMITEDNCF